MKYALVLFLEPRGSAYFVYGRVFTDDLTCFCTMVKSDVGLWLKIQPLHTFKDRLRSLTDMDMFHLWCNKEYITLNIILLSIDII